MLLHKDGITVEVLSSVEIARLMRLGYQEVKPEPAEIIEEQSAPEASPEAQNAEAVKAANKPIGSRKAKKQ